MTQNTPSPFGVTEIQNAYLIGRNENMELGGVGTHLYSEIESSLDITKLNCALNRIIARHPILRTVFILDTQQQVVKEDYPKYHIEYVDVSTFDTENQEYLIKEERDKLSHRVFDPTIWPLFELKALKLSATKNYIFFNYDMLIGDGFSLRLFESELLKYYHDDDSLPKLDYSFKEYISTYEELQLSKKYERAKAFHLKRIDTLSLGPDIPLKKSISDISKPTFKRLQYIFTEEEWGKFKDVSKLLNVTPTTVLCVLYAEVLNLWSSNLRYTINITVFNRYPFHENVDKIMGDFTSVLLMEFDKNFKGSTREKLKHYQTEIIRLLSHRHYDGVSLLREISKKRNLGTKALTPVVFTSMLYDKAIDELNKNEGLGKFVYGLSQTPQVLLDNQVSNIENKMSVIWDYVDNLFDERTITNMFENYKSLIYNFIETKEIIKPTVPKKDIDFIEKYNSTKLKLPDKTLNQLFSEQVVKFPDKICIVCSETKYTYAELEDRSNKLANHLIDIGVKSGDCVGVKVNRHCDTMINVLGILKAGAAYVPIEPSLPEERIEYILDKCNIDVCLYLTYYAEHNIDRFHGVMKEAYSQSSKLAYIIFTSGSTGNPKGVMVSHKSAVNTILDINQRFSIDSNDRVIGLSSMGFDLSIYDIFGTFSVGATLYMVSNILDVENITNILSKYQITFWNSVPSVVNLLVQHLIDSEKRFVQYESMRNILLSGDWIPTSLPSKLRNYFPNSKQYSLGGATEGAIWSIYYPIDCVDPMWKSIPYGYPLSNQQMYVLDRNLDIAPLGCEAEIFIGGTGVTEGYIGEKEKTEYAFIKHPTLGNLYRTGDYGIMHNKGWIEFKGRKDSQVKIKGHRIELGEIESILRNIVGVLEAIAVVFEQTSGHKAIAAYIVKDENEKIEVSQEYLNTNLSKRLPQYMIPLSYLFLEELPLTQNQKVDKNRLPKINITKEKKQGATLRNLGSTENKLIEIWSELLETSDFDTDESFFDLGGDSLQAYRVIVGVENVYNIKLPVEYFYKNPTISGITNYIKTNIGHGVKGCSSTKDPVNMIYFWNPTCQWRKDNNKLYINNSYFQGINLFPEFYFLTQEGICIDDLCNNFNSEDTDKVSELIDTFISVGILINELPNWSDLFKPLRGFSRDTLDQELLINPHKYSVFKKHIMERTVVDGNKNIPLKQRSLNGISKRRSYRNFDESQLISFDALSKILATFKQNNIGEKYTYNYASAGGLYPIDVYLNVKKDRVENLKEGLYYYHPPTHSLKLVNSCVIDEKSSLYKNKEIFKSSAITAYYLFNPTVSMPIYGGHGYYYAIIDSGIMIGTITQVCEENSLGICSIGEMDFDKIKDYFKLMNGEKFLHSMEIGLKTSNPISFEEISSNHNRKR
ncbi:non-ribosomal peptide synthetase [Saccharicrinis aurantiacus]|uniref:non-ribosomal peptide synthetase n=1 Tax=Saccharicrinis aurantiacus TaxID=1849719 RepID=UPI00094FED97|nr:non-ribosomal peptide synthetase [Saccharicrinis aurantiacus]